MANMLKINGKRVSKELVEVFLGAKGRTDVPEDWLPILEALQSPLEFPLLLAKIAAVEVSDPLRLALARCQIDSDLRMRENLDQFQRRLYVSQIIEKVLFGDLLIEGKKDKGKNGDDEEKENA